MSDQLSVTNEAVVGFLRALDEKNVPLEKLSQTLAEIARRHVEMLDRLAVLDPEDPATKALIEQARTAIDQADYNQAEVLLAEAEERDLAAARQVQAAADKRFLNAAAIRAERGELSLTRLDYLQAAEHFKTAGEQVPEFDYSTRGYYLNLYAGALQKHGDEKGDNAALLQAIGVYHKALGELTRERVPLDWATTQNNLGTALTSLGERESGTARLEQAVAAYKAALDVFRVAGVEYYLEGTENNLSHVERILADRQ